MDRFPTIHCFLLALMGAVVLSIGTAFGEPPVEESEPRSSEPSLESSAVTPEATSASPSGLFADFSVAPLALPSRVLGDKAATMKALKGFQTMEIHVRGRTSKSPEFRSASALVKAADSATAIRLGEQEALERGLLNREMTAVMYAARDGGDSVQLGWAAEWKTSAAQGGRPPPGAGGGDRGMVGGPTDCTPVPVRRGREDLREIGRTHTARLNTHASDIDGQLWQVFEREYRPVLEEALEEFEGVPTGMKRMDFGSDGEWEAYQCDRGLTQWVEGVTACLEQGAGCPYGPRFSMSNGPVFGIKFPGVYLPEECVAASRWQQGFEDAGRIAISEISSEVDAVWMEEAVDLALLLDWIEELEEPCGFTGNLPNETSWTVAEQAWQEALDAWRSRMVSPEDAGQWNPSNVRIRPADVGTLDGVVRYATESSAGRDRIADAQQRALDALRSLGNSEDEIPRFGF